MAMTQFEKAVINELQGIKKELHEMNKKKPEKGQVDGIGNKFTGLSLDGMNISEVLHRGINGKPLTRTTDLL